MKISSFGYLTRQGLKNLWRNRMMTLASVGVLTACLLIVGIAVLLTVNLNKMVQYVESENEFKAFIVKEEEYLTMQLEEGLLVVDESLLPAEETAEETVETQEAEPEESLVEGVQKPVIPEETEEEEQITELDLAKEQFDWDAFCASIRTEIESIDNVDEVIFVSKDEGILEMKEQLGDQAELLSDYEGDDNPLNDSFTIRVKDLTKLSDTIAEVSEVEGIHTVTAASSVAKTLTQIRKIVNVAGWSLVGALVIVSLVIITNTIRASIFSRRKELNIMSYVGATKSFIRLPFIVEGIVLGLISAGIAYGLISFGYGTALNKLVEGQSGWLSSAFESLIPYSEIAIDMALYFLVSSILIGVIGSTISIRSHIKV